MALFVTDPETRWLIITNAVLGIVVAIALIVALVSVVYHLTCRKRRMLREVDEDMRTMFGSGDDHTFRSVALGVTMADGGERIETANRRAR